MDLIVGYYISERGDKDYWCLDCFEDAPLKPTANHVIPMKTTQFQFRPYDRDSVNECLVCGANINSPEAEELAQQLVNAGEHPDPQYNT